MKVHSWDITETGSKGEQPFLQVVQPLDLIYMPTKYHQNISKGIKGIKLLPTDGWMDGQTDRQIDKLMPG